MTDASRIRLDRYDQSWFDRGRNGLICVLWDYVQMLLVRPSPHPCYGWRRFWWRRFGAQLGRDVRIRRTVRCNYPWKVAIGDHAWIGDHAELYALERITIGAHAVISQHAYLCTGAHDHRDPHFGLIAKPIAIGDGAWIALGATVMPGVTVGDGAVVGARALLTHDAPAWTIMLGMPARPAGTRAVRAEAP